MKHQHSLPVTGIDTLLLETGRLKQLQQVALLTNRASTTAQGVPTAYALGEILQNNLSYLLSPEHGWSAQGEDGKDVHNEIEPELNKPIYSLYGPLFEKTLPRLKEIKALIIDIQDVGVRCYTFASTCAKVLEYLSTLSNPPLVIICDRPNPLGKSITGPPFNPKYKSLVHHLDIPFQHGKSIAELLSHHNASLGSPLALDIIPYQENFCPFEHRWIPPSPALPNWSSVLLYPGLVLLEGVNLSLGRGTDKPFSSIGAPDLDTEKLLSALEKSPGLSVRPLTFTPQSSLFQGELCQGITFHMTNPETFDAYGFGLYLIKTLLKTYPAFQWVHNKKTDLYWIDTLLGNADFRSDLSKQLLQ